MSQIDRRYFDALMASKKLSLRGLAQRMGMNHSQLSLSLSGARRFQLDEVAQLSQIFGEPVARIIEHAGVSVRPMAGVRVPVVGHLVEDGSVRLHGTDVVERASAPDPVPEDAIAIHARTAGTVLDWADGWLLFCRVPDGLDPSVIGRFSYCLLKDGTAVAATVRRGYREGTYNLSGLTKREDVALEAAAPILLIRP